MRELIRSGSKVDTTYADDRARFIRQIVGIATNVNQLTKRANELGRVYYSDILQIQDYLKEVRDYEREVLKV